jgi:hypothetical protein
LLGLQQALKSHFTIEMRSELLAGLHRLLLATVLLVPVSFLIVKVLLA